MQEQRSGQTDRGARASGSVRLARLAVPGLAIALVATAVIRLHDSSPRGAVPAREIDGWMSDQREFQRAVRASQSMAESAARTATAAARADALVPLSKLNAEQLNIARFIASKYRMGAESTSGFVYHAYRAAKDIKVDPYLILAVMSIESSFNPRAQSHAGAQGLMQVLTRVHADRFMPFGGITAAFDPVANIRVGAAILKEYLDREGTVEGALKSYVGAALLAHDGGYSLKVMSERARIAAAASGRPIQEAIALPALPDPALQPVVGRAEPGEAGLATAAASSVAVEPYGPVASDGEPLHTLVPRVQTTRVSDI